MAGMGQKFNLPGGMNEALSDYKAVLKATKEELIDIGETKTSSGAGQSRESRFRNKQREMQAAFAEASSGPKPKGRALGPRGGNQTEARKDGGGDGMSVKDVMVMKGAWSMLAGGVSDYTQKKGIQQVTEMRKRASAFRDSMKNTKLAMANFEKNDPMMFQILKDEQAKAKRERHLDIKKRKDKVKRWRDWGNGNIIKKWMAKPRWGGTTSIGGLGAAATVGIALGLLAKSQIDRAAEGGGALGAIFGATGRSEALANYSREGMILNFTKTFGASNDPELMQRNIATARAAGDRGNAARYNEKTWIGRGLELAFGRNKHAIAYQDKMIESSLKRQIYVDKYGDAVRHLVDKSWIDKNQSVRKREEMRKELNFVNYGLNWYYQGLHGDDDHYEDFTSWMTLGWMGNDVDDAELKAYETIQNKNIADKDKAIKESQEAWNDTRNTNFAVQRIDFHERQTAITSFNKDQLTRGLTWN